MQNKEFLPQIQEISSKIYTLNGIQVMLDSDLAELYQVSIKRLNEQVKRNIERFPEHFLLKLTPNEVRILRSQIATSSFDLQIESSKWGGRRYLIYAFTEQGVAMLSGILRSKIAIEVSIQIMNSFVNMRKFIKNNANIFHRIDHIEKKQITFETKTEKNFERIFDAIENKQITRKQGIFFNGQVFDAYKFISDLIRSAKKSIILIDNYVDDAVLTLFSKRNKEVEVKIYTKNFNKQLKLDLDKYNSQYPNIKIFPFKDAHDRFMETIVSRRRIENSAFMIIDETELYYIGASLKDLGKKWFAFSKFNKETLNILKKLK